LPFACQIKNPHIQNFQSQEQEEEQLIKIRIHQQQQLQTNFIVQRKMRLHWQVLLAFFATCSPISGSLAFKPVVILHGILSGAESMSSLVREIEEVCYWTPLVIVYQKAIVARSISTQTTQ